MPGLPQAPQGAGGTGLTALEADGDGHQRRQSPNVVSWKRALNTARATRVGWCRMPKAAVSPRDHLQNNALGVTPPT